MTAINNGERSNVIRRMLESVWLVPAGFMIAFICWNYRLSTVSACVFSAVFVLITCFCKNVRNIYALILFMAFFMRDITGIDWSVYLICIVASCLSLVILTIRTFIERKGKIKKGKMFYALLIADAAFLLGGSIGRFDIVQTGIVLGFSIVVLLLYFLALNCTEGLTDYLATLFIVGAFFVVAEIMITKINEGDLFSTNPMGETFFFSAQSLNTAAIFIMLGIAGCYKRGVGKKTDFLYLLLSIFFMFAVFLSCCRTVLAVSAVLIVLVAVMMLVKTPRKAVYGSTIVAIGALTILVGIIFTEKAYDFVIMIIKKLERGLNGRDELWPWCISKFFEYPALGYGFMASEEVPTVRVNLVLAHNTVLQWFTSLGVIGASLMLYFYVRKYKTLFMGAKGAAREFTALAIVCVELTGMLDQAAAMDIFVFLLPLVLLAGLDFGERQKSALPAAVNAFITA